MRTVGRKPVVAAIALPTAAVAAVVGASTVLAPSQNGTVSSVDSQPSSAEPESSTQSVDYDKKRGEEAAAYAKKIASDPKVKAVKNKTADLETPSASASSSDDSSSDSSSSDSSSSKASSGGVSFPACSVSSSVEKHFASNSQKVYRAVCARFPQVKSYGGYRNDPGSDHGTGHAVDIMITGSTGDAIRDYVIKNRKALGVKYVIWEQKIYAPYTGWKGRAMKNRGGATANHFDHVHVSVN